MKIRFLGTRGEIEARTDRNRMHSALEVSYRGRRVMIDAGEDWLGELESVRPRAIVLGEMGVKRGVDAALAHDGLEIVIR